MDLPTLKHRQAYLEPCEMSLMDCFPEFWEKRFIVDIGLDSNYAFRREFKPPLMSEKLH